MCAVPDCPRERKDVTPSNSPSYCLPHANMLFVIEYELYARDGRSQGAARLVRSLAAAEDREVVMDETFLSRWGTTQGARDLLGRVNAAEARAVEKLALSVREDD